ncbi:MAG: SPOR domain-containing protein [Candidatus Omnitrophota bacterium]
MSKKYNLRKLIRFIVSGFSFTFFVLHFALFCSALNLEGIKVDFLNGDYKSVIKQGEEIMRDSRPSDDNLDELYYLLGLSYLKDGNYLRASDIFEIILGEFKHSRFKEYAAIGLGDTYLLREDFNKAKDAYLGLLEGNPNTKFKAEIYYRLNQIEAKLGDARAAKEELEKLIKEFPLNQELKLNQDVRGSGNVPVDFYYTVQVGSFTKQKNADRLMRKLLEKGYSAYIEDTVSGEKEDIYRVRVGRYHSLKEAEELRDKLSLQGYPTKIIP